MHLCFELMRSIFKAEIYCLLLSQVKILYQDSAFQVSMIIVPIVLLYAFKNSSPYTKRNKLKLLFSGILKTSFNSCNSCIYPKQISENFQGGTSGRLYACL